MASRKFPSFRKKVKDFLSSEEGKITRGQAASIATFLLMAGSSGHALAGHGTGGEHGPAADLGVEQHCSHGSHGSHGSW